MAEYVCKIADSTGKVFEQVETALSENEARHRLSERGFYVYSINRNLGLASRFRRSGSSRLVRGQDFLIFNQQFNTLIKAGLPILTALDLLAERAAAPRLRPLLADVRERVRDGRIAFGSAGGAGGVSAGVYDFGDGRGEERQPEHGSRSIYRVSEDDQFVFQPVEERA